MPSTKIQMKVTGIRRDGGKLLLDVDPVAGDGVSIEGSDADLPAFKKLFDRTVDARVTIGADEEQPAAAADPEHEEIKRQLEAEKARGVELEKRLNESLEKVGRQIEQLPTPAAAKLDPNHPVVKLARGALTVINEQAMQHGGAAKGGVSGHFFDLARTAKKALEGIEQLVAPEKPANGKLALAPPPPPAGA